jgi:hypothetical protein
MQEYDFDTRPLKHIRSKMIDTPGRRTLTLVGFPHPMCRHFEYPCAVGSIQNAAPHSSQLKKSGDSATFAETTLASGGRQYAIFCVNNDYFLSLRCKTRSCPQETDGGGVQLLTRYGGGVLKSMIRDHRPLQLHAISADSDSCLNAGLIAAQRQKAKAKADKMDFEERMKAAKISKK